MFSAAYVYAKVESFLPRPGRLTLMTAYWVSVYKEISDPEKMAAYAALAAHASPAYGEALAALDGGAVRDIRIIPGV